MIMKNPALLLLLTLLLSLQSKSQPGTLLQGAFTMPDHEGEHSMIMQDGYFMHAVYNFEAKQFKYSEGGTLRLSGDSLIQLIEFSTHSAESVGSQRVYMIKTNHEGIVLSNDHSGTTKWKRVDAGASGLAGNWRITGRREGEDMKQMPAGDRKTLKILSETRFQWAAINPKTKEFFGTGGGTYTFINGKYTEHIRFFSRDSSRVGASLTFDAEVEGKQWHHTGKSSAGQPIDEIWSRVR